jgi:phosphopantetheinyl transferase
MGNLSQIDPPLRFPLEIPAPGYLADHRFDGKPVLPAVEAMEALARAAICFSPSCRVTHIENAHFERFLFFDPADKSIEASADISVTETGDLTATLITRSRSPKAGITRTKTHAAATFLQSETAAPFVAIDVAAAPEGICRRVPADRIYRELVPFGPAYRNIQGDLLLGADGALAEIVCPAPAAFDEPLRLGSPFALDAAFHAACVWGQHHHRVTAFPIRIGERSVYLPTEPGRRYFARIIPTRTSPDLLVFDIWLIDQQSRLRETAREVEMRDPSSGRLKPPAWIAGPAANPLADLRRGCDALAVVELSALAPFASHALSPLETVRFEKMGPRRKRSFLGARLALKRLFRNCREEPFRIPAEKIETVVADSTKPCCCFEDVVPPGHVSAAHDSCFAIAVCGAGPIGVDVEVIAERALRSARLFMSEKEQLLLRTSLMTDVEAAVRIWSVKEVVSKASGMLLPDAWHRVEAVALDVSESRFTIDGEKSYTAVHATVDNHLFTLFSPSVV